MRSRPPSPKAALQPTAGLSAVRRLHPTAISSVAAEKLRVLSKPSHRWPCLNRDDAGQFVELSRGWQDGVAVQGNFANRNPHDRVRRIIAARHSFGDGIADVIRDVGHHFRGVGILCGVK